MKTWTFLFTFGHTSSVYAKGNKRKILDNNTGRIVVEYERKERDDERRIAYNVSKTSYEGSRGIHLQEI